jgi:hypothetical protein
MSPATNSSQLSKPDETYTPASAVVPKDAPKRPKTIGQLEEQKLATKYGLSQSQSTKERLDKRENRQRERIDKRIGVLKDRAAKTRGDRGAEALENKFNPQAPTLPPNVQAQVMSDFGPASGSIPSVPSIPNSSQKPRQGPTGFTSGGLFAQAPQGVSGGQARQTGQTGQASQDFSSLTSSLEAFNTGFSASVKELVAMPKEFKHDITIPPMSITLNGAEFIARLPEAMREAIVAQINKQLPEVIAKTTQSQATGMGPVA